MARRGDVRGVGETGAGPALTWVREEACATVEVHRLLHAPGFGAATSACNRHTSLLSRIWAPLAPNTSGSPVQTRRPPPALACPGPHSGQPADTAEGSHVLHRKSRRSDAGNWSGPGPLFPARQDVGRYPYFFQPKLLTRWFSSAGILLGSPLPVPPDAAESCVVYCFTFSHRF